MILDNIEEKSWKDIVRVKCEKCSISGENHRNWGKKLSKELRKK